MSRQVNIGILISISIKHSTLKLHFDYSEIDSVKRFSGTHPEVMKERIERINWKFERDPEVKKFSLKLKFLHWVEKNTGWRVGENKNYLEL